MRLPAWPFGTPAGVPAWIRREIEAQQYRSEIWVARAQILVALLVAVLYASAPVTYPPDAPLRAVPLGISLFVVLVLVRLWFAITRQITAGFLAFSVVAEMAVLLGTIWATHLQFEQPPGAYLKGSEFLYIFLLIALRALRFEPIWVLLSGISALAGWSLMLAYALGRGGMRTVTWDNLTGLTSLQIYPAAEFDRLLTLALVTAVLALALHRASALLSRAVQREGEVASLSRFFDDGVASRIKGAAMPVAAGQGERRQAAILFIDMRGFTHASAAMTPDELIGLLGEYQQLVVPIVRRHHGSIDKFMGDGILASFGALGPDPSYAANAFRAVDELMQAGADWQAARRQRGRIAPAIGAGLTAGDVVFGVIGVAERLEYTVIGDTVNLAAKLEKHNKAEASDALADHRSYELAREQGYAASKARLEARRVGGIGEPLDLVAWRTLAPQSTPRGMAAGLV